jgi:hypothetical protein
MKGLCGILPIVVALSVSAPARLVDYKNDSLKVTDCVRDFVRLHHIEGSDLDKIETIIDLLHDESLFIPIDRKRMETWVQDPQAAADLRAQVDWLKTSIRQLDRLRRLWPLSREASQRLEDLQEMVFYDDHDLQVFENVIGRKDIYPRDVPFAVSGAEAVEYGISDGCTTATKAFIVLAKAAGIQNIRFVATGCTSDYDRACPAKGRSRDLNVTISGHFFALVEILGRWALVNATYLNSFGLDEASRYEIFFELEGQIVTPETLKLMILRIPSFQKESLCQNRLYVIGIGADAEDDMDIENWDALMNMSVCGDRNCPTCKYDPF